MLHACPASTAHNCHKEMSVEMDMSGFFREKVGVFHVDVNLCLSFWCSSSFGLLETFLGEFLHR